MMMIKHWYDECLFMHDGTDVSLHTHDITRSIWENDQYDDEIIFDAIQHDVMYITRRSLTISGRRIDVVD